MISKQALGNTLWGMADILRDKVEDYKAYILSLLFFKRLSDNYKWETENAIANYVAETGQQPNERQLDRIVKKAHDFIIPQNCFWEDVRNATNDKKNEALHKAVTQIADENPSLKGIINTVRWNEPSPDGSGGKKLHPDVLTQLINYLDALDLSNKNVSVDILGDAYEYLIKRFADENKGGTTAGQFYTPPEVVNIIVRYLKPSQNSTVYDPTCGSGGFLINAHKYIQENYSKESKVRVFGQEDVWNTWAIGSINMILHGIDAKIVKGDTLRDPKFKDEESDLKVREFNYVMANFPFSLENWWKNGEVKKDKKGKAVTKKDGSPQMEYPDKAEFSDPFNRFTYGIPPFSNGDFSFIQHIIASMDDTDGKAGIVCPQGVLFRGQPEKTVEEDGQNRKADDEYLIRKGLLDDDLVEAVVVLPGNLFYGTGIPGSILFLNKNKPQERQNQVLFVYAAKAGWYKEDSNQNTLLPHDELRISTILESWGDIEVAKEWIKSQKERLYKNIEESLEFKLAQIDSEFDEDIQNQVKKLFDANEKVDKKLHENKTPTKTEVNAVEKAKEALEKLKTQKDSKIAEAEDLASKEKIAINDVEIELLEMFATPELRKRYFHIANKEDVDENEYNLNIPRYVDTFEPEIEIDLGDAINDFTNVLNIEEELENTLKKYLIGLSK